MIHLEKNQAVTGDAGLVVASSTGDYEDNDLVECYSTGTSGAVGASYQAQYVKYGNLVYQYNDPVELGKEILKVDPKSTHTAASYVRMTEELLAKMNNGSLEPASLETALSTEQDAMEERRAEPQEETVSDKPSEPEPEPEPEAPAVEIPPPAADVSSTTPAVIEVLEEATSTPALEAPADAATTTDEIVSLITKKIRKKLLS